jgi:hypothetical protein
MTHANTADGDEERGGWTGSHLATTADDEACRACRRRARVRRLDASTVRHPRWRAAPADRCAGEPRWLHAAGRAGRGPPRRARSRARDEERARSVRRGALGHGGMHGAGELRPVEGQLRQRLVGADQYAGCGEGRSTVF